MDLARAQLLHVVDSCSVVGEWTIRKMTRNSANRSLSPVELMYARRKEQHSLLNGSALPVDSLLLPKRLVSPEEKAEVGLKAWFGPQDPDIATELEQNSYPYGMLGCENSLKLDPRYQVYTDEEVSERMESIISAQSKCHYLRLSDCREMLFFDKPLVLLPHREWRPPGRQKRKNPRRRNQRATPAERREAAVYIRCLELIPTTKEGRPAKHFQVLSDYPWVVRSAPRFGKRQQLDYAYVSELKPGDELAPRYPLTRAYDPDLSSLKRDPDGANVLTDFEQISIPLHRPDWELPEVVHLRSLKSWGDSYEVCVLFLEGKYVDSLEDLLNPGRVDVERLPKNAPVRGSCQDRDRRGQCYHSAYESISVVGPYFIFKVKCGGQAIYLLDSPLYGIALRAFWRKEHAHAYAQGGESRQHVMRLADAEVWERIIHDPEGKWITEVDERLRAIAGELTAT